MEGIAADLAVYYTLTVVYHFQTLARTYGKVKEVLEADGRVEHQVVSPDGLPSLVNPAGPVEGRTQINQFRHVILAIVPMYGHDYGPAIAG
jgi:hypothetical protein